MQGCKLYQSLGYQIHLWDRVWFPFSGANRMKGVKFHICVWIGVAGRNFHATRVLITSPITLMKTTQTDSSIVSSELQNEDKKTQKESRDKRKKKTTTRPVFVVFSYSVNLYETFHLAAESDQWFSNQFSIIVNQNGNLSIHGLCTSAKQWRLRLC